MAETNASQYEKAPSEINAATREQFQRTAAERQELFRKRIVISDAVGDDVPLANPPPPPPVQPVVQQEDFEVSNFSKIMSVIFILGVMLLVKVLAPQVLDRLNRRFNPWMLTPEPVTAAPRKVVRAEEEAFAKFLETFQVGPPASRTASPTPAAEDVDLDPDAKVTEVDLSPAVEVEDFRARAEQMIATQRGLLEEINRASEGGARQRALATLANEVQTFKAEACGPELQVVRQVSSAMEGLLKQLVDKAKNVTPSTLRTVTSGVELLNDLSASEPKPGLLSDYPLRLLVVDHDRISSNALILALKKLLTEPHLAVDSEAAHALAGRHAYDVIFVNVQMPGMDGFELCTGIHENPLNFSTPVVFVTPQSDFDAWTQSALGGGNDLIGKPFLTFEVILKTLTLTLQRRLQGHIPESTAESDETTFLSNTADTSADDETSASAQSSTREVDDDFEDEPSQDVDTESFDTIEVFREQPGAQMEALRGLFDSMLQTVEEDARKELLSEAYVRLRSFAPGANMEPTHPVMRMRTALRGLFRKLLQNPARATTPTLVTAATGVDLLNDLCGMDSISDLTTNPPIRILIVDDNAVSRRALTNALQMAFEKPECVDNGEAALALAEEKRFDVIFLDVQMPGMDGFAVCGGIRETALNQATPVVYISGQDNFNVRNRMSLSGGNDFVAKPFLTSEVTVKALTFTLRRRLQELEPAQV